MILKKTVYLVFPIIQKVVGSIKASKLVESSKIGTIIEFDASTEN